MKKKIISLCLVVALALTAIGGATLAYFTDNDQKTNNFTIGNIDIEVTETTGIYDERGGEKVSDVTTDTTGKNVYYNGIMPTQYMAKTAVVKNTSASNEAYVRVFVTINNYAAINAALDNVYENKLNDDGTKWSEEQIQAMYDNVFDGFDIQHSKDTSTFSNKILRGWMDKNTGTVTEGVELLAVDYVRSPAERYQFVKNTFYNDCEKDNIIGQLGDDQVGYYANALEKDSRTYILYLKMAANTSYTLFNGLYAPAEFTNEQMEMFKGLKIGVYADAIQAVGFNDTVIRDEAGNMTADYTPAFVNAFNALEAEHHMGWWK